MSFFRDTIWFTFYGAMVNHYYSATDGFFLQVLTFEMMRGAGRAGAVHHRIFPSAVGDGVVDG